MSTGLVIRSCWPRQGSSFFYFCCFSDSSDPVSGTVDLYIDFLRCPFDETYVKKIMKGWLIQRVFMHSADILAFCGSPEFYFCLAGFLDPGRRSGDLWSLSCGTYCTLFYQDRIVFPETFSNYGAYQQTTPFLIPDRNSTAPCMKTMRNGGKGGESWRKASKTAV